MLETLEAWSKGEEDLKLKGFGCKSHIWKKTPKIKQQNPWNFKLLKPQKHGGHAGVSLNQNYLTALFPTRIFPLWIKTNSRKEKGEHVQETTVGSKQEFRLQVSNESSSFSSGKAEIKGSIAKRQVGLDFRGN